MNMKTLRMAARVTFMVCIMHPVRDTPIITQKFLVEQSAVARALVHCQKQAVVYIEYHYRGRHVGYLNPGGLAYLPENWSNENEPE